MVGDGPLEVRRVDARDVGRVRDGEVERAAAARGPRASRRRRTRRGRRRRGGARWPARGRGRPRSGRRRRRAPPGLSSARETARMPLPVPASRIARAEGAAARAISTIASVSPRGMRARGSTRKVRPEELPLAEEVLERLARGAAGDERAEAGGVARRPPPRGAARGTSARGRPVAEARSSSASYGANGGRGEEGTPLGEEVGPGRHARILPSHGPGKWTDPSASVGAHATTGSGGSSLALAPAPRAAASEAHAIEHEVDDDARDRDVEPDGERDARELPVCVEAPLPREDERVDGEERDDRGEDACASGGSRGRRSGRRRSPGSARSRPRRGRRGRRRGRGSSRRRPRSSPGGAPRAARTGSGRSR